MNITFSWERELDRCVPACRSNLLNQDGLRLLDCLLTDNGGLPYLETIPWLDEGVRRLKSVASGELASSEWARETWGVEINKREARIYSLHDEKCFQTVNHDAFSEVLQEWIAFLRSKPDDSQTKIVNLPIGRAFQ
jgi:hypothetical protein